MMRKGGQNCSRIKLYDVNISPLVFATLLIQSEEASFCVDIRRKYKAN